jgi:sirohydrochlorin cobaltochelatase
LRWGKDDSLDARDTLILLAHGSRTPETPREMSGLAAEIQAAHPEVSVRIAFLDLCDPGLPEAVGQAVAAGAAEIRILPLFLFSGKHIQADIPRLADQLRAAHPQVRIVLLEAAGRHSGFSGFVARAAGL